MRMEVMRSVWWIFSLVAVIAVTGGLQVEASKGYDLHSVVKEYANQQGFEAKLEIVSDSGNDTLGPNISPLTFIVR